jgi:hypothetical protein
MTMTPKALDPIAAIAVVGACLAANEPSEDHSPAFLFDLLPP